MSDNNRPSGSGATKSVRLGAPKQETPRPSKSFLNRNALLASVLGGRTGKEYIVPAEGSSPKEAPPSKVAKEEGSQRPPAQTQEPTEEEIDALFDVPEEGSPPTTPQSNEEDFGGLELNSVPPAPLTEADREVSGTISEALIEAAGAAEAEEPSAPPIVPPEEIKSERDTLPPAPMISSSTGSGQRAVILPGSPPEIEGPEQGRERAPTLVPVSEQASAQGLVNGGELRAGEEITERTFNRVVGMSPEERAAEREGLAAETLRSTIGSMDVTSVRTESMVERNLERFIHGGKIPVVFRPFFEEATKILHKNLQGYEADVERMIFERRWKYEREQRLLGSISASSDELQRVFKKLHKTEAVQRTTRWTEPVGNMTAGEAIKQWAFTILSSHPSGNDTRELNIFDAYAKAATFLLLSQHRPRTFMAALGRPKISKPYGQLGGMEALGVLAGLDLPDPSTTQVPKPIIGLAFRLSQEVRYTTLIGWLQDLVATQEERRNGPEAFIVGRFGHFVSQELRDFQEAVQDAGLSAEMFFSLLNREDHSGLREDEPLNRIFENAARGPGRMIYHEADDIFDALEAIVGYMNLLKYNPRVRGEFLEHFLGTYPLSKNGGTFYKMFNMSLFSDREDMEGHPHVVAAFRRDPDESINFHIDDAIRRLQPRKSQIPESELSENFDLGDLEEWC